MNIDIEKFNKVKADAEEWYKNLDQVECPFLKRKINFNVKGLRHIKFKAWNKTRSMTDQYLRLKFLRLAPAILGKSGTLQEFQETKNFERVNQNSRWKKLMVPVKYYGFVAVIRYEIKVKVIVKEVYGGQPYFWSIIPFWKNRNNPITQEIKKVFHEGDLEND